MAHPAVIHLGSDRACGHGPGVRRRGRALSAQISLDLPVWWRQWKQHVDSREACRKEEVVMSFTEELMPWQIHTGAGNDFPGPSVRRLLDGENLWAPKRKER